MSEFPKQLGDGGDEVFEGNVVRQPTSLEDELNRRTSQRKRRVRGQDITILRAPLPAKNEQIDPEMSARYEALLSELKALPTPAAKKAKMQEIEKNDPEFFAFVQAERARSKQASKAAFESKIAEVHAIGAAGAEMQSEIMGALNAVTEKAAGDVNTALQEIKKSA